MKRKIIATLSVIVFGMISGCVKDIKDAFDESVDAVACANLLQRIQDEEGNRPCAETIADIDDILNTCDAFLSDDEKEDLIFARNNCQDN